MGRLSAETGERKAEEWYVYSAMKHSFLLNASSLSPKKAKLLSLLLPFKSSD